MRAQELPKWMIPKLWGEFNGLFHKEVSLATQQAVKELLERGLREELEEVIGCKRYERSPNRKDYRHGSYARTLGTTVGTISFRMPRAEKTSWEKRTLKNYQRREDAFDMAVMGCFLLGGATRKSAIIAELFTGTGISPGTVSNILKRVDRELVAWRRKKLEDRYRFLVLDGLSVPVRLVRGTKRVVLLALGVTKSLDLELVGFLVAPSESELYWRSLLENLAKRGLVGDSLQMIAHDGCGGIQAAVAAVYPYTETQLCVFHVLKNVDTKVKHRRNRKALMADASWVYDADELRELERRANEFRKKWEDREQSAVRTLFRHLTASTKYFQLPKSLWPIIRTTNKAERFIEEIRRRINPMRSFANVASCERIIFALAMLLAPMEDDMPTNPQTQSLQTP